MLKHVQLQVPLEFKEVRDDTVVAALSHHSPLVRFCYSYRAS